MLVIYDDVYTYAQWYVELDMISDMLSMLSDMICSVHSDIWNFEYIKGLVLDILETS